MLSYKEKLIRAAALLLAGDGGGSEGEDWTRAEALVEDLTEDPEEFLRENREAIRMESQRLRSWAEVS